MQALIVNLLMKSIRHGLTAIGGAGLLAGDQGNQLMGAVSFLVGFGWSAFEAWQTHRAANPKKA